MTPQTDPDYLFERSKDEYDRLAEQAALIEPMTENLFREAGVAPGMRVLDIGSGVGDVAFLAARLVGPHGLVVGVDIDPSALRVAEGRVKALGVSNVTFVLGDIRTADVGADFDAAVGRLVLIYLADPAEALRSIAGRVRRGGVIAFQEVDFDPAVQCRSFPEGTLWDQTGRLITETFAGAGTHLRMGRQLRNCFLSAGLPAPAMREETIVGAGPYFAGYSWLAGVARGLAPLMARLGIAGAGQLDPDTLPERIRDDAVARDAVVWGPAFVAAHAVKP